MKIRENRNHREHGGRHHIDEPLDDIRHEAYLLWQQEGCPENRDLDHWLAAKELVRHRRRMRRRDDTDELEIRPTEKLVEQS
ncbi:MAG: DUF2934 domain-containing protein [Candidatus Didemnitutus sp.]|nr:DUF2934 domain-containing protein [Candidatus Didemnitutus sp.]